MFEALVYQLQHGLAQPNGVAGRGIAQQLPREATFQAIQQGI
jgi:hypothetical protein